ncbi:hypothetical protein QBC40DRAFT_274052 [Triangularia verruculosa]|uniref:Uncharacterized protein n=1 Tax=Triangularia verruculosa TaxID=2587418 RepID=A0AAN6XP12_9PEZI|nr:hypothetical protein QBC40DRAFT_274052 [Triangularia verruculosa]
MASDLPPNLPPNPPSIPHVQTWTPDGYPIVDNKYLDLSTGTLKTHTPGVDLLRAGPPSVAIYWQNRHSTGSPSQFHALSKGGVVGARGIHEYIIKIGEFLKAMTGRCKLDSSNATRYDVYVVVYTELSQAEFRAALEEAGLL